MSYRSQNNTVVNYYTGLCDGCRGRHIAARSEKRNLEQRWVKCADCGTVTLVRFEVARSPEMVLDPDEWAELFTDENGAS